MDRTQLRWFAFRAVSVYFALLAIYRVVIPARGLPAPSHTYKMIWVEVGLVAVFLLGRYMLGSMDSDDVRRDNLGRYFWIGLIGAAVILGLRLMGGNSFWSGHLVYQPQF